MSLSLRISRGVAFVFACALVVALTWSPWSVRVKTKTVPLQGDQAQPRLTRAKAASRRYWGKVPCQGNVTYRLANLHGDYIGYAQWDDPEKDGPPYVNCLVLYERKVFGHDKNAPYWFFCAVTIHEVGHLLGHGHVRDPDNVMYPRASQRNTPTTCKRPADQGVTGPVPSGGW